MFTSYWQAAALRIGLRLGLPETTLYASVAVGKSALRERVITAWQELGLLDTDRRPTQKGALLRSGSIHRDRALYWLQDRYLRLWLPQQSVTFASSALDVFSQIALDPALVQLSQRVLASYAEQDWRGIESQLLPLRAGLRIVDLGGG